jgi:hypothetical protein
MDGEAVGAITLTSIYQTYLAKSRSERTGYLRDFVSPSLAGPRDVPEDYESARPNLRIKLWSRAGLASTDLQIALDGTGEATDLRAVPIGEPLLAAVAYDFPDRVQTVPGADLDRWGVTIYEAIEAGNENLARTTDTYGQMGENLFSFVCGDSYDACRILLIDQIRKFGVAGRPVAMVVNRDAAYITGEDREAGLRIVADLAADSLSQP